MKHRFEDLLFPGKTPLWYDENGTPRYVKFHPDECPCIYNNQSFLVRILCQECHFVFDVEISYPHFTYFSGEINKLHYGDPPAHGCVGDTMNCEDTHVIQAWNRRNPEHEWKRVKKWEKAIE